MAAKLGNRFSVPIHLVYGGATISATKTGIAYGTVPADMTLDHVDLAVSMSSGNNSAGSGAFSVDVYYDGVLIAATATFTLSYSETLHYATFEYSTLAVAELTRGKQLRLDVVAVPGGAATSYPNFVQVTLFGQAK